MIRKVLVSLLILVSALNVSAVSYRGFIDFNLGWGLSTLGDNHDISWNDENLGNGSLGIGFTTSHGVQVLPKLFVGVGAGMHFIDGANHIPVFGEVRVDFFGQRRVCPFVGVKLGYAIGSSTSDYLGDIVGSGGGNSDYRYVGIRSKSCFYFQPSAGLRFRMGHRTGMNVAITYFPWKQQLMEFVYDDPTYELETKTVGYLGFSLGFDF